MEITTTESPATTPSGHVALTEELREQIRERLLGELDVVTRRRQQAESDPAASAAASEAADAIRAALGRLDAGTYSTCEGCEGPIPFERLDALPAARTCVTCQQRPRPLLG